MLDFWLYRNNRAIQDWKSNLLFSLRLVVNRARKINKAMKKAYSAEAITNMLMDVWNSNETQGELLNEEIEMSDYIELYKKLELLMKENKENKIEVIRLTEQLEQMEQH